MKTKNICYCLAMSVLLLSSGCGIMPESKKVEYKSAGKLPPLDIPPDLTAPTKDDRYAVPDKATPSKGSATYSVYKDERTTSSGTTASSEVLPEVSGVRVERAGNQRWLVVSNTKPEKLWYSVKEFWQENGLLINIEQPEAGIMETEWSENRAKLPQDGLRNFLGKALDSLYSTAERDKYRTRLERMPDGSTEIYISHRGMSEVYVTEGKADTRWQPREPDPELEAEMLRRLMVRLGVEETKAKAQISAPPKQERAKLVQDNAGIRLQVVDGFDRAWRRVGLALDRVGFTVEDRDRSQGVYFVRYVDPEADAKAKKDESWLSKMAFWKSNDKDLLKNSQYRIHVTGSDSSSQVKVLSKEGGADNGETARKILTLLHEQLK